MSNDKPITKQRIEQYFNIQPAPTAVFQPDRSLGERFMHVNKQQTNPLYVSGRQRKGDILSEYKTIIINSYYLKSQFDNLDNLSLFLDSCQITPTGIKVYTTPCDNKGKRKSYKVTVRTIEYLFNLFNIPYHAEAVRQLLENMHTILDQTSANNFLSLITKLNLREELVRHLYYSYTFYDKYLIYIDPNNHKSESVFRLQDLLKNYGNLEQSDIKKILKALYNRHAESERLLPAPGHRELEQLHSNTNYKAVFCLEHKNYGLEHKIPEESSTEEVKKSHKEKSQNSALILKELPPIPYHSIKKLPLENYKRQFDIKEKLSLILEIIAGSIEAADRLAMLFADIAMPGPSKHGLSVILTGCNEQIVMQFLKAVFDISRDTEPISVNQMFTPGGKQLLLDKHIQGVPLIMIKDTLPNHNKVPEFAKLINGKKISVKTPPYPNQHFYSQFHLVCITSNQRVANNFAEYGANIISLEAKPIHPSFELVLSRTELNWLRSAFILHGCRLRYIECRNNRHKPEKKCHSSRIYAFFAERCEKAKGNTIERSEMYSAYCEYHKAEYGCEPTESSIVFIKEMKNLLPEDVVYKVNRYGEDKKTHMCFVGLRFKQVPPTEKICTSAFSDYLDQIEEYADSIVSPVKNPEEIFRIEVK